MLSVLLLNKRSETPFQKSTLETHAAFRRNVLQLRCDNMFLTFGHGVGMCSKMLFEARLFKSQINDLLCTQWLNDFSFPFVSL